MLRGIWVDPRAGTVPFGKYAMRWVAERPVRPRTCEIYEGQLRHIVAVFRLLTQRRSMTQRLVPSNGSGALQVRFRGWVSAVASGRCRSLRQQPNRCSSTT